MDNFSECFELWLKGIGPEIKFWDNYMKEKENGIYGSGYQWTVERDKKFTLEEDIPREAMGGYSFLDVGSGPFSRCGISTDKVMLEATSVDPLAYTYNELKHKHGIDNGVEIQFEFAETLNESYKENSFDMVHMSNSLDHSFDPIHIIWQLLYVCKIGGKIILRHTENEAKRANYTDFHLWNLSLHNAENSFVIWRENKRYDICKMFGEYADIELYPDQVEEPRRTWIFNKVVFTKKKNVQIPENSYKNQILKSVFKYNISNELKQAISNNSNKFDIYMETFKNKDDILKGLCQGLHITNLGIAGFGKYGKWLYDKCKEADVEHIYVFDKNPQVYKNVESMQYEKEILEKCEIIVVTSMTNQKNIEDELLKYDIYGRKVIDIERFMYLALRMYQD